MSKKFTRDDVDKFIDSDIFLPTRTLYIGNISSNENGEEIGIDFAMAERCIKNLHILENLCLSGDKQINIILNSCGGSWNHGMAIYNSIKKCKNHVTIVVSGQAMSAGAIILQAGDERLIDYDAEIMIHYGHFAISDTAKTVSNWSKHSDKNCLRMEQILLDKIRARNPDFSLKKLKSMLSFDTILSSEDALNLGLVDGIIIDSDTIKRNEGV